MQDIKDKYRRLVRIIKDAGSSVVAFSGGVDSTLLVKAVKESGVRYLAVTGLSPTMPKADIEDVRTLKGLLQIKHRFIQTDEHKREEFARNDPERCFYCKDTLFGKLREIAEKEGYSSVLEGTNADDLRDYRPGLRACKSHNVLSPLAEARITKSDVRELLKMFGIWLWSKPSSPCLSSRVAYGVSIDEEVLRKVEAAEVLLRELGFRELRVRHHGEIARIEIPEKDIDMICKEDIRAKVVEGLLNLGYKFVTLDLEGLISGKMNRLLK